MKTKCPSCGATASLDVLLASDGAREAVVAALSMPAPVGKLLIQYLALFRPAKRELTFDRVATLLNELLPMIQAGSIDRAGRTWPAPIEYWRAALEDMLTKRDKLDLPMRSHGYLLEIIAGMGNKAEAKVEAQREQEHQQRTGGLVAFGATAQPADTGGSTEEKKPSLMEKTPEERREISARFLKGFKSRGNGDTKSREQQLREIEKAIQQEEKP